MLTGLMPRPRTQEPRELWLAVNDGNPGPDKSGGPNKAWGLAKVAKRAGRTTKTTEDYNLA